MSSRNKLTDRPLDEDLPDWGVLVLESHHSPQFTMDWREHDFLKLVFVLRGRGVIEFPDRVTHFRNGELVLVPPKTPNRIADAPDAASSLYICCISAKLMSFDAGIANLIKPGLVPTSGYDAGRVATQLRRMRHLQHSQQRSKKIGMVAAASRLIEWVVDAVEAQQTKPNIHASDDREAMQDYVRRLAMEFYEATTIDDTAKSLGMSRRTFTRLFQEITGQTWLTYVRKIAVNHAKHQLAQTGLSIASIAFECGFNDLSTFYRQFKSQTGVSPKAYRKQVNSSPS
ncbi:AraC family transcriptional regulator [Roseiconus lacunae]|uniref:AraC family transcriptional regulator n=1 Tax=Roseiconus lacunae TaxID=2605694 RepID=UPI0011F346FB|nr:AraC family transcriptional regulator [Roseiconus lacunae]